METDAALLFCVRRTFTPVTPVVFIIVTVTGTEMKPFQNVFTLVSQTSGPCVLQKLKVLFAVGNDGEVSEPLEVKALSCDTVEQVKEKILSTFKAKFGFSYSTTLRDLCLGKEQARFSTRALK